MDVVSIISLVTGSIGRVEQRSRSGLRSNGTATGHRVSAYLSLSAVPK